MAKRKTMVPFTGTEEQQEQLMAVIAKHQETPGALMPVLQEAQEIYGYLPIEVQIMIAEGLALSLSEVYGVVTFYSQFSLNPKGKYPIAICMGTACYVKGAGEIVDRIARKLNIEVDGVTPDGLFSLEATRCIGACGLAPVFTIGEDVYGKLSPQEAELVVDKYKA